MGENASDPAEGEPAVEVTPGKGTGGVGAAAPRADQGILGVRPKRPATRAERRRGFLRWLLTGERPEPSPSRLGVLEPFRRGRDEEGGHLLLGRRHPLGSLQPRGAAGPTPRRRARGGPLMGKLTRAPVRFVMALANLRLGVWVTNPRHLVKGGSWQPEPRDAAEAGADSAKPPPDFLKRPRLSYLFREILGRNRVDARFLYVHRRGPLREPRARGAAPARVRHRLLLRRERRQAVRGPGRRARAQRARGGDRDRPLAVAPERRNRPGGRELRRREDLVAKRYRRARGGRPPRLRADRRHRRGAVGRPCLPPAGPVFPHHSTAGQLYTDQRFEAYRALGEHAGDTAREKRRAAEQAQAADGAYA